MIKSFFAALSFISRLPVPGAVISGHGDRTVPAQYRHLPLVGLLLGAIAGAVVLLLQPWCGVPLAALFGVLALALLTGGFHLDGWLIPATAFSPPAPAIGCWRSCATAGWAPTAGWR